MGASLWGLSFEHLQVATEYRNAGWAPAAPVQAPSSPGRSPWWSCRLWEATPDSSGNEVIPKQLHQCQPLKPHLGFSRSLRFINVKTLDL